MQPQLVLSLLTPFKTANIQNLNVTSDEGKI